MSASSSAASLNGLISLKHETLSRVNRWLYHGLHSLDFPFLYRSRPAWDLVVVLLSAGGIVLSVTTLTAGWRRLRRHARRPWLPAARLLTSRGSALLAWRAVGKKLRQASQQGSLPSSQGQGSVGKVW